MQIIENKSMIKTLAYRYKMYALFPITFFPYLAKTFAQWFHDFALISDKDYRVLILSANLLLIYFAFRWLQIAVHVALILKSKRKNAICITQYGLTYIPYLQQQERPLWVKGYEKERINDRDYLYSIDDYRSNKTIHFIVSRPQVELFDQALLQHMK